MKNEKKETRIDQLRMKYTYIMAWGILLGSFEYYINMQLEKAEAEGAPEDAVYAKDGGTGEWQTLGNVKNEDAKDRMNEFVENYRKKKSVRFAG